MYDFSYSARTDHKTLVRNSFFWYFYFFFKFYSTRKEKISINWHFFFRCGISSFTVRAAKLRLSSVKESVRAAKLRLSSVKESVRAAKLRLSSVKESMVGSRLASRVGSRVGSFRGQGWGQGWGHSGDKMYKDHIQEICDCVGYDLYTFFLCILMIALFLAILISNLCLDLN